MKRTLTINFAQRIEKLPPYLFAVIDEMKSESIRSGVDVIDLSIGDPDLPTLKHIVEKMKMVVENPLHHRYPSYVGMLSFREAVAAWYKRRFNVDLEPASEILTLIGSKEGIGHVSLAFINEGDVVLSPSPGYPVYPVSGILANGETYVLPLLEENNYLPDLKIIPSDILKKAKLLFINYPNNPTSAEATESFFEEIVEFAYKHNIIVCHDAAYSEIYYDNKRPVSFLEIDGAKEVGVEFHSLSKTYNMTGWRIGFVSGNRKVIEGLGKIKTNIDSGVFQAIQVAGIEALSTSEDLLDRIRETYQERRNVLYNGLTSIGLETSKPNATFYIWTKIPKGRNSIDFIKTMLKEAGVLATPGNGFGDYGEGYIRFALTEEINRMKEAIERLKKL